MHCYNTSYYYRFRIRPDEFCFCGLLVPPDPSHVRDHTFHLCKHYEEHRPILSAASRHHHASLIRHQEGPPGDSKFPTRIRCLHDQRTAIHAPQNARHVISRTPRPPMIFLSLPFFSVKHTVFPDLNSRKIRDGLKHSPWSGSKSTPTTQVGYCRTRIFERQYAKPS